MALNQITYSNKADLNINPDVPATNKVQASDMNEIKTVVNACVSQVDGVSGTILWTNPNPSSVIASSTNITLSSNDYDVLECYYKASNDGNDMESTKVVKGMNFNLSATGYQGAGLRRRITYNSDTSYTIGLYNGETLTDSGTGKYIIPIYLIGYKTGLF
jgi:hypothetical protein